MQGFVMITLNKSPHVKPDLVWDKQDPNEKRRSPQCMFCQEEHLSDECKTRSTVEQRKVFCRKELVLIVVEQGNEETSSVDVPGLKTITLSERYMATVHL